jgi:hypothetical protein
MSEERGRESVFTRPAHLDNVVARIEAGESFADCENEAYSRYGGPQSGRYSNGLGRLSRDGHNSAASHAIEDMGREMEVLRRQNSNLERQLAGAVAELELHKRHCHEFRTMLEVVEGDLATAHENYSLATVKCQSMHEASRRNSEMAQQVDRSALSPHNGVSLLALGSGAHNCVCQACLCSVRCCSSVPVVDPSQQLPR